MKKLFFIGIIIILFFSPRIYWQFKTSYPLDITIIDKTVPVDDYREHLGLFWVLTNEKVTKTDGELYTITKDYFGYDPKYNEPMNEYNVNREVDLIYIADTYGVYTDDLEEVVDGDRSRKIYGGMEVSEWEAILRSKGENTTLIAEYNSFATPTEEHPRSLMEETLSVDWSGWSGRYFDDLTSDEVPQWLITNYENQYQREWPFKGAGLAFVHITDKVIVLDQSQLEEKVLFTLTAEGKEKFPTAHNTDYPYWFDILTPLNDAVVYAEYDLHLSNMALEELKQAGIPTTFPAIIHNKENHTYYFAGDYADYTKDNLMKWQRSDFLMNIFSNDTSNFFWTAYVPIMRVILEDVKALPNINRIERR
ncbi:hypothetical protein [Lysinibacillus sp. LZ02]|uniref:hypothetical protein n=1 Tax=Lysinibacillus sp. LZ02 TaxID=3420668 RepID=UPI003D368954